jgi:3-phenylpropionate/trans-cinnamate dioxygenase ferredoxin reductase subunit
MTEQETVIIVGAGLAGHSAAEALRRERFNGRIVLFGEESQRPYDRPPLSKEFLKGEWKEERLYYRPASAYCEQRIELRLNTRVEGLDTEKQLIFVADAEPVRYDHLLLALGGYPRRLTIPGGDLAGIHYLRTLEDSIEISKLIQSGAQLVVVGAGFIGCEVAAALRAGGVEVTLLEALPLPMGQAFGPEIGEFYAAEHRAHGVNLRLNEGVSEFVGRSRVESVISAKGHTYQCTGVVVGVGITPCTELLKNTPIAIDNGILVDEYCRTNVPNVYAVGDVANWWHPTLKRRLRIEHWDHACNQAVTAIRNMLGQNEVYRPVPYVWTDQYDLHLQVYGHVPKDEAVEFVMRGSYQERSFNIFYHIDRRLVAAVSVNRLKDARAAIKLIETGVEIIPSQLADALVDIKSLVKDLLDS